MRTSSTATLTGKGRVEGKRLWYEDSDHFAKYKSDSPKGFEFGFKLWDGLTRYAKLGEDAVDEWVPVRRQRSLRR